MLYVKIENGKVTECWDCPPPVNELSMWAEAVEVKPTITENRQQYTTHSFDLNKTPVEIVWGVRDITVDERKAGMKAQVASALQDIITRQSDFLKDAATAAQFDLAVINTARADAEARNAAIDAAETHDSLDALNA